LGQFDLQIENQFDLQIYLQQQGNSTHGFINGNLYRKCVDGLPGFKHLLADLHSYRNPAACETPFFKEVVAALFDIRTQVGGGAPLPAWNPSPQL
jgi:hypothetical protein